jgi:hypothetical protein
MNTGNTPFGNITFLAGNHTELFRISRDGIWAHPDVPVDETAQKVIEALDSYIKELVQKAVEDEREACIELTDSRCQCAWAIKARGER